VAIVGAQEELPTSSFPVLRRSALKAAFLATTLGVFCLPPSQSAARPSEPPPVEAFFRSETSEVFRLSPLGNWIAFLKSRRETSVLCIRRPAPESGESMHILTQEKHGQVFSFLWLDDSTLVFAARTPASGCQIGSVHFTGEAREPSVRILAGPQEEPEMEGICDGFGGAASFLLSLPREARFRKYYRTDAHSGERTLLHENREELAICCISADGRHTAGTRFTQSGECELVALDERGARVLLRTDPGEVVQMAGIGRTGCPIYIQTNAGGEFARLEAVDWDSGKRTVLAEDPMHEVDLGTPIFDRSHEKLLGATLLRDRLEYMWTKPEPAVVMARLRAIFGDVDLQIRDMSLDGRRWIVSVWTDRKPESDYFFDSTNGDLVRLSPEQAGIPDPAPMLPIQYRARDGQKVAGYLTIPANKVEGPLPLVLFPHGGPHMRNHWGFDPRVQFLASRGYAVLQPNFRGSIGFGKTFQRAGFRQWGRGVMQDDLSDAVDWMIRTRQADPLRIAIFGGSYGGYAALAGVAFTPEKYAAGISLFGPSDLNEFIRTIPPGWMPFESDLFNRIGNPAKLDDRARLKNQSPLYSVESIRAPLLIFQGARDNLIQRGQADAMVAACRAHGKPLEYLVSADGPHGFTDPLDEQAVYVAIEKFLARHLGGTLRSQVAPAIQSRLKLMEVAGSAPP
jgi:dipeptidyl aminopeptidase/acylaminoacyl peptidase